MNKTIMGKIPTKAIRHIVKEAVELAGDSHEEALQIMLIGVLHILGELGVDGAEIDMDGIRMKIKTELTDDADDACRDAEELHSIGWNEMSNRGLVFRINHDILHPLGLALSFNPETDVSERVLVSPDGGFSYSDKVMRVAQANGWIK